MYALIAGHQNLNEAPNVPTILTVLNFGPGSLVKATWEAGTGGYPSSYEYSYRINAGSYISLGDSLVTQITWDPTDDGASGGETLTFRLLAKNSYGSSGYDFDSSLVYDG